MGNSIFLTQWWRLVHGRTQNGLRWVGFWKALIVARGYRWNCLHCTVQCVFHCFLLSLSQCVGIFDFKANNQVAFAPCKVYAYLTMNNYWGSVSYMT